MIRFSPKLKTLSFVLLPAAITTVAVLTLASSGILAAWPYQDIHWPKHLTRALGLSAIEATTSASPSAGLVLAPLSTPASTPIPTATPTTFSTPVPTPTSLATTKVIQPTSSSDPLAGFQWYVDPNSNAKQQADAWRSSRPADAASMDKIAQSSWATWFGGWSGDIYTAVHNRVATVAAAGDVPVMVAYNIPQRDCGGYSAGGVGSPDAYKSWIRSFAQGIGGRKAVVILEPDALAGASCLSAADQQTRFGLLADAVNVLESNGQTYVYLDAGNSNWVGASDMASRLKQAGIDRAQGFSLNVSNFNATANEIAYGTNVSNLVGGKHFVVDTSRNGLGAPSDGSWCNPSGRALGERPTASTGNTLVDAFLWVKAPGESDGTCNGGPSAGTWWPDYALGLAQRASW